MFTRYLADRVGTQRCLPCPAPSRAHAARACQVSALARSTGHGAPCAAISHLQQGAPQQHYHHQQQQLESSLQWKRRCKWPESSAGCFAQQRRGVRTSAASASSTPDAGAGVPAPGDAPLKPKPSKMASSFCRCAAVQQWGPRTPASPHSPLRVYCVGSTRRPRGASGYVWGAFAEQLALQEVHILSHCYRGCTHMCIATPGAPPPALAVPTNRHMCTRRSPQTVRQPDAAGGAPGGP